MILVCEQERLIVIIVPPIHVSELVLVLILIFSIVSVSVVQLILDLVWYGQELCV